ncbi:RNA polymerase II transcription elongation factor-domain-containing protein [Mycena pura]|uniref:RNA polymerase II transcription elongation factor-domain-containing protein n=1 Tax=Mycena pura TaxID=153505 RepID=A0AAD7E5S2_9AGAR|nr:RNA polymerase II transcription elongation factor-domain-containing protein [Mycena pura]
MSSSSWIPQGTHEVVIGPSLHKALKARKGGPPPQAKRVGPPERDFYSFHYNFKPPSLDNTKPGTIELTRGKDATTVIVEHPSSQPGENHIFTGKETPAKELDCVLIYDEETGSYKLEKLEAYIVLTHERKTASSLPASTASSPPKAETDSSETRRSMEVDAEGEVDDDVLPNFPPLPLKEEEEEEEGELEPVPVPAPPPVAVKPSKPPPAVQKPRPAAKPAPQRKPSKRAPPPHQAEPGAGDIDEEVLEFGHPSVKRGRWTPPTTAAAPAASAALPTISFPGSSTDWVPPPAPPSKAVTSAAVAPPPPPPVSDSEDDGWEEVPAGAIAAAPDDAPIEIEIDVFEAELEKEMLGALEGDDDGDADADADAEEGEDGWDGEPEDFLARALPHTSDAGTGTGATPSRVPLSMGQLGGYTDDEYSSSEESEDD